MHLIVCYDIVIFESWDNRKALGTSGVDLDATLSLVYIFV